MELSFVLEQPTDVEAAVQAGGIIKGKLVIHATSFFSISANHIALYFRGKEYTQVQYDEIDRREGTNTRTVRKTANEKHEFTHTDMPVPNEIESSIIQGGKVVPGRHEVPFCIALPSHIPSSMCVSGSRHGDSATIAYCLRAKLKGSGILQDYQARQPIRVVAQSDPTAAVPIPYILEPNTKKIKAIGIFSKGDISYGATMETTKLVPGQQAQLKMALINNSKEPILHVKVELREVIHWSARGHSSQHLHSPCLPQHYPEEHFMTSEKLDKQSLKQTQYDTHRHQRQRDQIRSALSLDDDNKRGGKMPFASLCTLPPLPQQFVHETYQGTRIRVSHYIRVKIKTKSLTTNPEFNVPLQIVQGIMLPEGAAAIPMATAEPIDDSYFAEDTHPPSFNPTYVDVNTAAASKPPPPINPTFYGTKNT